MEYQNYAKIHDSLPTSIHTKVNSLIRISSIYRRYGNAHFESWGWETIVWKNDKIEEIYAPLNSADEIVNLHTKIVRERK